jgi:sRNA-binding protein
MIFQESWEEFVIFGIIFGVICIIDLLASRAMRRRVRQREQQAAARHENAPATANIQSQDEELAKWEDIVLTSTERREKIIAISQIGRLGNVDDIELLEELANTDSNPDVQVAIKGAIAKLQAKIG